jgi:hypothetical protein
MSKRRRWSRKPKRDTTINLVEEAPVVAICIPSDDMVHAAFSLSLVHLIMHTLLAEKANLAGLTIQHIGSSLLPESRYSLVKKSLELGATHLLFLDSDMTFPQDTIIRMLEADKDVVGINAMARRPPYNLTAWYGPGRPVQTTQESEGLEKVWRTGFGVVMIKARVFEKLNAPYFDLEYVPEKDRFRGEDYFFFDAAREAGFELYIDQDLSKQVNHFGSFAFNPLLKLAEQQAAPEGPPNHEIDEGKQPLRRVVG